MSQDVGRLLVWAVHNYGDSEPIFLTPGEDSEISIRDAALLVAKGCDFTGEVVFDTTKSDGQYKKTCDNAKLRKILPDFKFTSFEEGIRETAAWLTANYDAPTTRK